MFFGTWNLWTYQTSAGRVPFNEWRYSLKDPATLGRFRARFSRIKLGNFGDHETVGQGVSELKLDFGPGYRIYYGQHGPETIVLLCGGDKNTQARDIEKAKEYWMDFQRRLE